MTWIEIAGTLIGGWSAGKLIEMLLIPHKLRKAKGEEAKEEWNSISKAFDDMQEKLRQSMDFAQDILVKYREALIEVEKLRVEVARLRIEIDELTSQLRDNETNRKPKG